MRYALVNGIILDGHIDMKPVSGKAVIINDGMIEAIVNNIDVPKDMKRIQCNGGYICP